MRFCDDVGLRAVHVRKEIPGFLWNRVWFALLREMLHLVDIGAVDPLELDSMVRTTLHAFIPVFGPLQMTDLIGHDTLRDISNALYPELADRSNRVDDDRSSTSRDGRLGVKSGRGFYDDNDAARRRAHPRAVPGRPPAPSGVSVSMRVSSSAVLAQPDHREVGESRVVAESPSTCLADLRELVGASTVTLAAALAVQILAVVAADERVEPGP